MTEIVLPRLGWTMEQGVFMGWFKRDGESVKAGEALFSVEGDKAVQEIEAIASGTVRIAVDCPKEGDTVPVGTVLGRIECATAGPSSQQVDRGTPKTTPVVPESPASPSVRRLARELDVELAPGVGSGRGGRVREEDVRAQHAMKAILPEVPRPGAATPRARRIAKERGVELGSVTGTGRNGRIRERDIPASGALLFRPSPLRQIIAQRMVHSARTTAPVTLTTIADAENLVNLRGQFKAAGADAPVPSFTDFFIKLTALTLKKHPDLNSRWTDAGIATLPDIHIGLAVDTPAGLVVPVVRNVPAITLRLIAAQTVDLAERARTRKLKTDEMQGGTFTITNLGAFGIDAFTPIINHPECAILGLGEIRKRAAVVGDAIVARHALTLSLTFDHRIVDGAPAARFLKTLRGAVENPSAWLLD